MSTIPNKLLALFAAVSISALAAPVDAAPGARRAGKAKKAEKRQNRVRAARNNAPRARQEAPADGRRVAAAANPTAKAFKTFESALKKGGSQYFVREVNGHKKIIANVTTQAALDKVAASMGKKADVIQIMHIGRGDIMHTLASFDGELIHTQYANGTNNWRLRNWGNKLRQSETKMFSAFIALTPAEAQTLRDNIKQGRKDQGPEHQAGPNWANGKLKDTSMGGCRGFNCTSVWSGMPLGKNGETLNQIAGLPGTSNGSPRQFQRALETSGNQRVVGIAVYGPQVQNFGANPNQTVTEL